MIFSFPILIFRKEKIVYAEMEKGFSVLLYGTFVMFLAMTMCLFFIQTFYLQQKYQDAQTAADSIADATAVYAATQSSDYDDVTAHAGEVQQRWQNRRV